MQTPASFPSSVSPNTHNVDPDQDEGFNLDAWASSTKDPAEYDAAAGFEGGLTAELPTRSSHTPDHDRPSWANLKTKAGKERKRLPLACIACRRKKIKCSGEKPTCQHCAKSRIPCVYKITQRKATPRTDYMAMLDKRLKRMEDRVIKIIPKSQADAVPRAIVKPSAQPNPEGIDTSKKRPAGQAFGETDLDLDGWAAAERPRSPSRLPRSAFFNRLDHGSAVEGAEALPSQEIQEHLAEVYFDYIYGQSYFLLHKPRYMLNLKAGNIPPYLSLAVCAVSARFSSHPELQTEPAFLRGEDWAKAAQQVAMRYFDTPNIITLIVFMLISLHSFGACQGGRAFMLSGMAHRMSYSLRLHRDPDHDGLGGDEGIELDFVDREMRRRAMWACFQMDRFTASGNEKPLFAREGYLNVLPLPVNEQLYIMEIPAPTEMLDGTKVSHSSKGSDNDLKNDSKDNMGVAAYIVKVIVLWGRLLEDMSIGPRAPGDETGASWPSRTSWQTLSAALRDFLSSLPPLFHFNMANLQHHASAGTAGAFLMLHLIYNHCQVFLHRFAFPVIAGQAASRTGTSQVLDAARQTALDAANAISDVVSHAQEHRLTVPFGGYVAYVSSAVHLYGAFSKDPARQKLAKHNLTINIKYLSRMKKHWGMYHILTENLKDMYRQYAEAARRGKQVPANAAGRKGIQQFADWHDKYPQGVSIADYEEVLALKPSGKDAQLAEKSDLQSVETWAANRPAYESAPKRQAGPQRKRARAVSARHTKPETLTPEQGPSSASSQPGPPANRSTLPGALEWPVSPEQMGVPGFDASALPEPTFQGLQGQPTPPDFANMGFLGAGDTADALWTQGSWPALDTGLLFNEPFMDWNAILNMDMMPGLEPASMMAQDASAALSSDAFWFDGGGGGDASGIQMPSGDPGPR